MFGGAILARSPPVFRPQLPQAQGFFLWQTLFATKQHGYSPEQSKPAYSEQQPSSEQSLGTSSPKPSHNPTEEAIAEYTKWLAVFTLFLVLATIALFVSGERNVDVARESAAVARDALIVGQRPWLSIIDARVGSPFTWDEKGGRVTIETAVKNVGKNPAFDVSVEAKAVVMSEATVGLSAAVQAFCDEVRGRQLKRTASRGEVFFPDDVVRQAHGLLFPKSDIAANQKAMGMNFFGPIMLVCIDYRSTITNERHATGLAFFILQASKEIGGPPSLLPTDKGTLPIETIGIARAPMGSRAD